MTDKPTGGLAFPTVLYDNKGQPEGQERGMTLRDWFAGQALAMTASVYVNLPESADILARRCYAVADAMLVERNK